MSKAPPFMVLLMRAIKARDFAAASRLIESEVEQRGDSDWLWQRDRYGRTVFSLAGGAGIRDALDLFRPYGIRWDAWSAATWGEVPQLRAIARQPSPPWSETLCYGTPLHWALTGGHEAAVRYLIFDVGIDVAATDDGYVRSAICGRNAEHLVPLLIEQGADVDWDASADTALQHQCNHGRTSHVALLIAHGADVNRPRKRDGRTSLHCAAATGIAGKLVRMLLAAGADPEALDHAGNRPIDLARRAKRPTAARVLHEAEEEIAEVKRLSEMAGGDRAGWTFDRDEIHRDA